MESHILRGTSVLDGMVARLPADQRAAFEAGVRDGYVMMRPEQLDLQRVWGIWCFQQHLPDVHVECQGDFDVVTMYLGPAHATLNGDGMVAVRRAFERHSTEAMHFQTRNWCKHHRVSPPASRALARDLVEIAHLDGVPLD